MRKTTRLKRLLQADQMEFFCEAHNGISAKIVEEAGFNGIWGSSLTMAAQFGVRDANEASWSQVMEMADFMAEATSVPILLDGDTGYGDFNTFRRVVQKLEQRDIAGVCIEDKRFPKTNSFVPSCGQQLTDIDEFCGKIRAAKDTQTDDDFVIVARVEAFVAGCGLNEALDRANAYYAAGADGVLIHSTRCDADEIEAFANQWLRDCPIIIIPTSYFEVPARTFKKLGISVVIWANHLLRASVLAMRDSAKSLFQEQSPLAIADRIASLEEVFALQHMQEFIDAKQRYRPIKPPENRK